MKPVELDRWPSNLSDQGKKIKSWSDAGSWTVPYGEHEYASGGSPETGSNSTYSEKNISDERSRIMDSIKRRSLETVPDYIYDTAMPERPARIERQIEGKSATGAELPGNVSPESQVQAALRRLMTRRG
jgi:hypothetical protein